MDDRVELKKGDWRAVIINDGKYISFDGPCVDDGGYGVDIEEQKDLDDLIELLSEVKANFKVNHEA